MARSSYVRDADPLPWLFTIVRRLCVDEFRDRARARGVAERLRDTVEHADITGLPEGVGDLLLDAERREAAMMAALEGLSAGQREAIVLTKLHGHSTARAALIAGTTPGALKVRTHRAYLALRRLFTTYK
jgi:RNA polymerase sigma-70 factor (ECF subfamily)